MNPNTYIGSAATWGLTRFKEPKTPPFEMPTTIYPYCGSCDLTAAFRAANAVGSIYVDPDTGAQGYILDNTPRSGTPCPGMDSIDLLVAFAPDFTAKLVEGDTTIKTASNSATITASGIITGTSTINAKSDISFYSPQTAYTYFSSTYPNAPRFTALATNEQPDIIRSTITASSSSGQSVTFGNENAPIALVSALSMPIKDQVADFQRKPIPGTPWYRCVVTVCRIYLPSS